MKKTGDVIRFAVLLVAGFVLSIASVLSGCWPSSDRRNGNHSTAGVPAAGGGNSPPGSIEAGEAPKTAKELVVLLAGDRHREAEEKLIAMGDDAVPELTLALEHGGPNVRIRAAVVLGTLGWYVTRAGRVERMNESDEFRKLMKNRLDQFHAE